MFTKSNANDLIDVQYEIFLILISCILNVNTVNVSKIELAVSKENEREKQKRFYLHSNLDKFERSNELEWENRNKL